MINLSQLIDEVDELLTDSTHPLDEKQARKLSLMMLRQIMSAQFEIQREVADWKTDIANRRSVVNERITKLEKVVEDVVETTSDFTEVKKTVERIDRTITEYPSITWLLRYRFSNTSKAITAILVLIYLLANNYPALADWLNLPPLP